MTSYTRTAAIAAALLAAAQPGIASRVSCVMIRNGDTAASLALHLTGAESSWQAAWFQIVEPVTGRFIPKTGYARILPGWQACVARDVPGPVATSPVAGGPEVGWWLMALLTMLAGLAITETRSPSERRLARDMQFFGARFIREFERPLLRPGRPEPALASRVRVKPQQRRLEILLAPQGRRTYPNLLDHRTNVEYDVGRVIQALKDERFVPEQLSTQGRWVIVRCLVRDASVMRGGT